MGEYGSIWEHFRACWEHFGAFGSFTEPFGGISHIAVWGISHIASRVRLGLGDLSTFNIDLQYQLPNIDGDIYRGYIFNLEHPYIARSAYNIFNRLGVAEAVL